MVRIGLIGCGSAGMSHLKEMLGTRGLRVAAVCDLHEPFVRAASETAEAPAFTDAEEMMRSVDLDAVAIVATASAHYPLARLAAENGLHVLCEKPLTLRPAEGTRLIRMFERRGLILAVTFTYRFVAETKRMKTLIDAGELGEIVEVRHVSWGGLPEKHPEGTERRRKYDRMYEPDIRGILFDCGVHTFDLFRWLTGREYVRFLGMGSRRLGYDYADSGAILAEMTGGVRCVYDHGPLPHYLGGTFGICLSMVSVAGTRGSIVWNIDAGKEKGKYYSEFEVNTPKRSRRTRAPILDKCRDRQYRDFVASVRQGRLVGDFPTPHDANEATRATVKAVDAVMRHVVELT